jgi:hypothetical protein
MVDVVYGFRDGSEDMLGHEVTTTNGDVVNLVGDSGVEPRDNGTVDAWPGYQWSHSTWSRTLNLRKDIFMMVLIQLDGIVETNVSGFG